MVSLLKLLACQCGRQINPFHPSLVTMLPKCIPLSTVFKQANGGYASEQGETCQHILSQKVWKEKTQLFCVSLLCSRRCNVGMFLMMIMQGASKLDKSKDNNPRRRGTGDGHKSPNTAR